MKRIFKNEKVTLDSIKRNHIIPVMQLTILKNGDKEANRKVVKLNKMTRKYCNDHQIEFIDLNAFLSMDGELIKELTTDGCHLKPNAYLPWDDAIKKVLEKYKI